MATTVLIPSSPTSLVLYPAPASSPPLNVSPHFAIDIAHGCNNNTSMASMEGASMVEPSFKKGQLKRAQTMRPIPKSAEYILDSDDSDEPLAQVVLKSREGESRCFSTEVLGTVKDAAKVRVRRRSWTPVEADADETQTKGFADLCKTFNFGDQILSTALPTAPNKRRRVEKSKTPSSAKATNATKKSDKKPRQPAKKSMTITALATAAYQAAPILPDTQATTVTPSMAPPKKRPTKRTVQSGAVKSAAKATKAKRVRTVRPREPEKVYEPLLPPSQAQRKLSDQAFIFGTSSQFQLDDTAAVASDLQHTMAVMEPLPSSPFLISSQEHASNAVVPSAPHGTTLTATTRRNLWRVSARSGVNGMYKEVADDGQQSLNDSVIELSSDKSSPLAKDRDADGHIQSRHPALSKSQPTYIQSQNYRAALKPLDANQWLRSVSPHAKGQVRAITTALDSSPTVTTPKRRGRPPTASTNAALPSIASPHSSPPSKRYCVDEIIDSEEASPSPARHRASPAVAQLELAAEDGRIPDSAQLPTSATNQDDPTWNALLAKLFTDITQIIKSTPRSNSLSDPTWHEKMLLYDPIVIEDFTAWLNEQGLRVQLRAKPMKVKKGADAPAVSTHVEEHLLSHWMVQKWCREHSICCLWKEGLRGGVRTKY